MSAQSSSHQGALQWRAAPRLAATHLAALGARKTQASAWHEARAAHKGTDNQRPTTKAATHLAALEARKTHASAMSAFSPIRPSGTAPFTTSSMLWDPSAGANLDMPGV